MAINIITSFNSSSREVLDKRSGAYSSVAEALSALDTNSRAMGMPIYVIADGTKDGAGNFITGTVQTYHFTGGIGDANLVLKEFSIQDTTNPSIAISAPSIVFEPFVATFTLSESVLNFTIDDIILIGGTKANFQINGLVATCDIDPTGVPYGNFSIIVQQNAFTDISGNPVSLSELNINYVQDETTPPTLTISSPSTFVTAPFTVSFTFSEDITGFDVNDINLTGGNKSNFTVVSQNVFTVLITPVVLGTILINVANDVCIDFFGNNNIGNSLSVTYSDVYIFDSYAPLYAWFFNEKLTTNSSNIYDIRRDIDNEITTVSFGSENEFNLQCTVSDGSTLAQWIGSNNGFITKAYDQMGTGLDAIQLNTARQLQIISSGNLILENNSPAGLFNGAKNYKITNYNPQNLTSLLLFMLISEDTTSTNTVAEVLAETTSSYTTGSGGFLLYQNLAANTHNIRFATENGHGDSTLVSNTKMLSFYTDLTSGSGGFNDEMLTFINNNPIVTNGQSDSSIAFSIADLYIGARGDSATIGYQGTVHGFSIFNGDKLPNRRKIESHFQTSFPNIFGQPDVLGSGNVSVLSQMDANIVFDGNSLTEGINGSGVDQYFPKKVRDYLIPKCVSVEFNGLGVSGYKMTQMRDNFDTRILPLVNANKTNILIFGEDANDILGGNVTGQQNFDLAVEYAQKGKNAGYNQVILWTGWYPRTAQQSVAIMDEQHNYFELVKSANINTVPWDAVVDMRDNNAFRWGKLPYATPLTQAETDEQATYFADYLHLTALGYDKVSEEIINEGILNLNTL